MKILWTILIVVGLLFFGLGLFGCGTLNYECLPLDDTIKSHYAHEKASIEILEICVTTQDFDNGLLKMYVRDVGKKLWHGHGWVDAALVDWYVFKDN